MPLKNHFRRSVPAPPKKRDSHESAQSEFQLFIPFSCSTVAARLVPVGPKTVPPYSTPPPNRNHPTLDLSFYSTPTQKRLQTSIAFKMSFDKLKKGRDWVSARWPPAMSSSPLAKPWQSSPYGSRSNKKLGPEAQASSSIAAHSSTRSVDVPPRSLASASSGAANSVKLVSGADDIDNQSHTQLPMPQAISSMTLSSFMPKGSNEIAQSKNYSNGDNYTNSAIQPSDHNGLPLRSAPNGNQKCYNMASATTASPLVNGNSPVVNGSYSSDRLPLPNNRGTAAPISTVRALSGQFGGARSHSNLRDVNNASEALPATEWSSAVGGATTSGKSGRMIEKLMGERDSLKRDKAALEMEKMELLAHVSMADEKAQRQLSENATELHEAAMNKMLLKKRDRQVAEMKEKIEIERHRADQAVESERVWKTSLEKLEDESKHKVASAEERALHAEGYAKLMDNHWKEEKAKVDKIRAKLDQDVKDHLRNVVAHTDTLAQRDQIYDQANKKMEELQDNQKLQAAIYESFKTNIDQDLSQLKAEAAAREAEAEEMEGEVKKTCDKMKWVMNVKKNVKDAE